MEKAQDRLEVLQRISEYERDGKWDIDVENDPESKELFPNQVDYLNKKLSSKIKTIIANKMGYKFYEKMIKDGLLIIKNIVGIENYLEVKGSALITCNHFSVLDNYVVYKAISPYLKRKKLYKVIREGNYTSMPGMIGFLFQNCNTLPLSRNTETMKKFLNAVKILLARGEKILIYPEQAMWWNYRKPRPFKDGAFKIAINNNVPVVPCFITMEDSQRLGPDGFPIQEFTVNFLKPIYPNSEISKKENIKYMKEENFKLWKECYENFYNMPLTYNEGE